MLEAVILDFDDADLVVKSFKELDFKTIMGLVG